MPAATITSSRIGAAPPLRREHPLQALGHVLPIIAAHHLIADAAGHFVKPLFQGGAPFRRIERAALNFARPDHVGEPAGGRYYFLNCAASARAGEIIRILTFWQ